MSDYSYPLPQELIAQRPADQRDQARLLVVRRDPERGLPRFEDLLVSDLPSLIESEPLLAKLLWVRNRSRVLPARFYVRRPSGGRHEIVLLEELLSEDGAPKGIWKCLARGIADFRYPQQLVTDSVEKYTITSPAPGLIDLNTLPEPLPEFLNRVGEMPLPPYIKNRLRETDFDRYQSLWSDTSKQLSVAAPTASLHFSHELLSQISKVQWLDTFLHVGLGTFEPYRYEILSEGKLHSERIEVPASTIEKLSQAKKSAKAPFCLAVGTTALRCLESLHAHDPKEKSPWLSDFVWAPDKGVVGRSEIFVRPGFEFQYTRALWTNFHLPESTLLVLVATFCGSRSLALEAYKHAVSSKYRFFSYGDASLIL